MQISIMCPKCHDKENQLFEVEINESFFKGDEVTCNNNHTHFLISKSPRYQFLLQQGLESYNLGFYFESFHTLYSAFEAYKKEFVAAHIFNETKDIESCIDITKKLDRSERMEGAFTTSYISLSNGVAPNRLSGSVVKTRNNVVHKGYVPDKASCEKIGNAIFKIIAESNYLLAKRFSEKIDFHPILLVYENALTDYLLKQKGYTTSFDTLEEFNDKNYIDYEIGLNLLSPNSVLQKGTIDKKMFTDIANQQLFIINKPTIFTTSRP